MISLPEGVALNLQEHADKKGLSQADLAVTLLDAIARDNLYDAVIDPDRGLDANGGSTSKPSHRARQKSV
jgi:hypothetical protein